MLTSVSTVALAQDTTRTLADNEALLIDGKTLTVTPGRAKGAVASQLGNVGVHPLGPGAIVFRSGDRLYVIDGNSMGAQAMMYDDRQRSYGGLNDPAIDRQQSYGGLNDDRQRSYGGLYDPYPGSDRQRSYGGLNDPYPSSDYRNDRQRSYGGLNDPYPSSDYRNDRQRSYGGLNDRQQSYGGLSDPDYTNYRLKKAFSDVWGASAKN
jgi:hypothetical protein